VAVNSGQATVLMCSSPALLDRWDVTTTSCPSTVSPSYSIDKETLVHAL
jgi:hypothetical protein